jgi:hypothetical protein
MALFDGNFLQCKIANPVEFEIRCSQARKFSYCRASAYSMTVFCRTLHFVRNRRLEVRGDGSGIAKVKEMCGHIQRYEAYCYDYMFNQILQNAQW